MSQPNIAHTGQFQGPYQYIHINDTSSHAVGASSSQADIWANNSSVGAVGGVIGSLIIANPSPTSTAVITLTVDNNTSSQPVFTSFVATTFPLNIGFSNSFVVSNSSASGHAIVTYTTNQP